MRHRESFQAHRAAGERLDRIEGLAKKLGWGILAGSFGVMVTVVSSALYVGSRFERIEGVAGIVEQHDRRLERLEERAMSAMTFETIKSRLESLGRALTWPFVALMIAGGVLFTLIVFYTPAESRELLLGANGLAATTVGYVFGRPARATAADQCESVIALIRAQATAPIPIASATATIPRNTVAIVPCEPCASTSARRSDALTLTFSAIGRPLFFMRTGSV